MPADLRPLLDHLPAWLMVLFRLSGIFILAPLLGSQLIFRQVKVFLVLGLTCCVYPMLLDPGTGSAQFLNTFMAEELSLWSLAGGVGLELLVGLLIGYAASLPLVGMQVGGHVIDQQIGLGLAGVFNPDLGAQAGVVGQFFFLMALTIFAILGGHRVMLAILIGSFERIPPGGFTRFGDVAELALATLTIAFQLAVRVAAPLLCLVFLETIALGFIARTVPQMNILSIGFPIRILMGIALMMTLVSVVADAFTDSMRTVLQQLMEALT